jgi:hypothetical protein
MFLLSKTYRSGLEATEPPTWWVLEKGGWDFSLDHSPPFNAEVKNECGCTSSHPACLLGVEVTYNWGGNVTFYCYDKLWSNTVQLLTKFHTPPLNAHNKLVKYTNFQSVEMKYAPVTTAVVQIANAVSPYTWLAARWLLRGYTGTQQSSEEMDHNK